MCIALYHCICTVRLDLHTFSLHTFFHSFHDRKRLLIHIKRLTQTHIVEAPLSETRRVKEQKRQPKTYTDEMALSSVKNMRELGIPAGQKRLSGSK